MLAVGWTTADRFWPIAVQIDFGGSSRIVASGSDPTFVRLAKRKRLPREDGGRPGQGLLDD
jgi:hypothetical protein